MDIKKIAKKKGYTMARIAEELGINRVTLAQSLNGNPTLHRLQEIANVLGCSVGDFFRDETVEPPGDNNTLSMTCPHCGKTIRLSIQGDGND